MHYQWSGGSSKTYGDSEEMFRHLEHLRSRDDLTMDVLERDAKRRDSPLYAKLEWNDKEAARKYRRKQLATIVNSIVKVNERGESRRVYVGVGGTEEPRHYDLVDRVMRKPEFRRTHARRALTELGTFEARFGNLPELAGVLKVLRRTLRETVRPALAKMESP
jgi:hypothetical protein